MFFPPCTGRLQDRAVFSTFATAGDAAGRCKEEDMIRLAIFDLDGTLLDTLGDLAVSCNAVLALRGLPQHSLEQYRSFVGNGIMRLVERALPEPLRTPYTVAAVRRDFVAYYTEHIDTYTKPYEGIPDLLGRLADKGVKLAVASNKFQAGTEKLVRSFFHEIPFLSVLGQREGVPLKPDPHIDREILVAAGVDPAQALHIGDSGEDMRAASGAGIPSVGVTWGFRTREELEENGAGRIVDRPWEIIGFFQQ